MKVVELIIYTNLYDYIYFTELKTKIFSDNPFTDSHACWIPPVFLEYFQRPRLREIEVCLML
jgi:hypothetical protein